MNTRLAKVGLLGIKSDHFFTSSNLTILDQKLGPKLDSGLPQNSSLKQQFKALYRLIPFQKLDGIKDIHAYLDIGMFFDTAMCSLQIPPDCLALLDNSGLTIEVTCYPCEESKPNN